MKLQMWSGRRHYLDKMTLPQLLRAYATYPAIQVYAALAVVGLAVSLYIGGPPLSLIAATVATCVAYPAIWYALHRFVLHGRWLYRWPATASVWKRIHFDHHQDPNDLGVLFGALYTTLPTIAVFTAPLGFLIAGPAGMTTAMAVGLVVTCFYEFCHCVQHLRFTPKSKFLLRMKKRHLAHHFHSERGNYGITNFFWDRVFGTYYSNPKTFPASPTVRNLGYDEAERVRYPWVATLSGLADDDGAVASPPPL